MRNSKARSKKPSKSTPSRRDWPAVATAAQTQHWDRLAGRANVLAVGVGIAYRERVGRFTLPQTAGQHATLAVKVIVHRKPLRLAARHRLPRTVRVQLEEEGRTRCHRIPVDVVLQGELVSGFGTPAAIDPADYPHTGFAALGHRLLAGHADAGASSTPPPLASGYDWEIGTVGAVVTDSHARYAVTAGHVLTDPYAPGAIFPTICRAGFSIGDPGLGADNPQSVVPSTPVDGGRVIDVVALPLTDTQAQQSEQESLSIANIDDLAHFHGQAAVIRVEREHAIIELPGTVEGHFDECTATLGGVAIRLGPTILVRCGGLLPTDGDSGAPVLARDARNNALTLLGFHIGCTAGSEAAASLSYTMTAWPALARAGLAFS